MTISEQTAGRANQGLNRPSPIKRPTIVLGGILLLALLLNPIQAQDSILPGSCSVTLAWTGSPSPAAIGYLIHYGTASGQYSSSVDVGNMTTSTVQGLTAGATYFFAISCYDTNGLESPLSNEISCAPGPSTVGMSAMATGQFALTANGLSGQSYGIPAAQGTYRGLSAPTDSARQQTNSGSILSSVASSGSVSASFDLGSQTMPLSAVNGLIGQRYDILAAQGTYRGLFAPIDSARQQTNSGSFLFSVTSSGTVSGNLDLGGQTVPLSGKFASNGTADIVSKRPRGEPSLAITLQLDIAAQSVSGTVSDGNFIAELSGFRDGFSTSDKATEFEGQYTLVIPGTKDSTVGPYGVSYGTVKVSSSGRITLTGILADGTTISQSSVVSQDGYWPMYVRLYSGKGSLWGWNYFNNNYITNASMLSWINAANSSKTAVHRLGFTNQQATLTGGLYTPSETLPAGLAVSLQDSNFTLMIPNLAENTNKLTLKTNKTTGVISGSFANPDDPKQIIKFNGVILQGQTNAQGYFLGTDQSGAFTLAPP
ncbi:MAG: hypothetical protein ACLQU4_00185 [Limisphaerales bacterium]